MQPLQMADSVLIFSALGMSSRMVLNGSRKQVPESADVITILPLLAAFSQNSTISLKNCPSSMPITSQFFQVSLSCLSSRTGTAGFFYKSWVDIQLSLSYRLSSAYLTLSTRLPEISWRVTLRMSSVLLPANIGPMIISMRPQFKCQPVYFPPIRAELSVDLDVFWGLSYSIMVFLYEIFRLDQDK